MNTETALKLFLSAIQAEDTALKTVQVYSLHIRKFISCLPSERQALADIRTSDVINFINHERSRGMSKATVYGEYRALSRFFNWCATSEEAGRPQSPLKNLNGERIFSVKKPPKRVPRRAELEVIEKLIDAIPQTHWIHLRNRSLLRILRDTGLRIGEAAQLKVDELSLGDRSIIVSESKSRRARVVLITPTTAKEIEAYLACRPACSPDVAAYLFVGAMNDNPERGTNNRRWESSGMWQMISKLCTRTGQPHINPHSIRHLFGTKALNEGIRLEIVSELMGHHDPSFTRKFYAELMPETTRREYNRYWT